MKKVTYFDVDFEDRDREIEFSLYLGTAREISRLYKHLCRFIDPEVYGDPKFNFMRAYGLIVNEDKRSMHVISSDTALKMLYNL